MRLRKATGFVATLALASAFPSVAGAANRFAEPGGNGAEPCAQSDPCDIATAVNSASGGDDITLLPGTYAPTVALGANPTVKFNITTHGSPGARPVVNFAGNSSAAFYVGGGSTLRDVDVNSTGDVATAVLAIGGGVLERVVGHASGLGSRACLVEGESTIRDSVCWFTGTADPNSSALSVDSMGGVETDVARNVTAVATSGPGIRVRSFSSTNAGVILNATNVFARGAGGAGGEDVRTERNATLSTPIQKVNLDHSNYVTEHEQDTGDVTDPGTGTNVTTAPAFVNAATGDFHQLGASTGTLNLGTTTGMDAQERDLDGDFRAMGSAPDIGADELGEAPAVPAITSSDPASGSNENNPLLLGTAEPFSFVHLFASSDCTGTEAGAEVAEEFASPGIGVSVPDDSTTTFTANAVNDTGTSECSAPFTYTEVTTQPAPIITPTPPSAGAPSQPATKAKKKCKKKKRHRPASVAKKKCKKKKKKR